MLENDELAFMGNKIRILVGEIDECERFYCAFRDEFRISHIVTNKEELIRLKSIDNLYIKYEDIKDQLDDYYIIICQQTVIGNAIWEGIFYQKGLYYKYDFIDSAYLMIKIREERIGRYKKKQIWLFGAGDNGEQFWKTHSREYDICGFVSNYESEVRKCGLPVIRLGEIVEKDNAFIIICSIDEISMYFQLLELGMRAELDFTFSSLFPKKLFVSVGACQLSHSVGLLLSNRNFVSKYVCLNIGESMRDRASISNRMRLVEYSEFCDVVAYQVFEFQPETNVDCSGIVKRYKHALKIQMPYYFFRGIHLQSHVDYRVINHDTAMDVEKVLSSKMLHCYGIDGEIIKMLSAGMDHEQICNKILSDDYYSVKEVRHWFDSSVKTIKFLDKLSDVKIAPFLIENYKKILVFTDPEHFGLELQICVANQLAEKMGIEAINDEDLQRIAGYFRNYWRLNVYIYPSVAKALELEYGCRNVMYRNTPYISGQELSAEEYIIKQINFVQKINDLMNCMI